MAKQYRAPSLANVNQDHKTSQDLLSSGRRVTRQQVRLIKQCFPFLRLPAELRVVVYSFSSDFEKLNEFFDKAFARLSANPSSRSLLFAPHKRTPNVYLINKQIFREASHLLQRQGYVLVRPSVLKFLYRSRLTCHQY